ncbi:MAG: hypothetical protein OEM77_06315 [Nitrosopumilus sp.]|nr:hypothetical protein [Nitrosopumilus sp.]MDH3736825.1 hypothetical protein [Nitrosopumilus sp.]MDH3823069.1 hypothetical protein [Nitrosopumilus sp.]MDH3833967.1 hypothetical protein [Nitrosopumilus sp.]
MTFVEKQVLALRVVFMNIRYIFLAIAIFLSLYLPLIIVTEFLFLDPYMFFYVPAYQLPNFISIVIISALTGLVLSMSVYRIKFLQASTKKLRSGLLGSFLGAGAGACCGGVGIALISIFGAVGSTATTFLTNFEIPIRLLSIGILAFTYLMIVKDLNRECNLNFDVKEK